MLAFSIAVMYFVYLCCLASLPASNVRCSLFMDSAAQSLVSQLAKQHHAVPFLLS